MNKIFGEFISGILVVAMVSVLVRPGSQGPGFVSAVTDGFASIIGAATGGPATSGTVAAPTIMRNTTSLNNGNSTKRNQVVA